MTTMGWMPHLYKRVPTPAPGSPLCWAKSFVTRRVCLVYKNHLSSTSHIFSSWLLPQAEEAGRQLLNSTLFTNNHSINRNIPGPLGTQPGTSGKGTEPWRKIIHIVMFHINVRGFEPAKRLFQIEKKTQISTTGSRQCKRKILVPCMEIIFS